MQNPKPPALLRVLELYCILMVVFPAFQLLVIWFDPRTYHLFDTPASLSAMETGRVSLRFIAFLLIIVLCIRVRKSSSIMAIRLALLSHIALAALIGYAALTQGAPQSGLLSAETTPPYFGFARFTEAFASLIVLFFINLGASVKEYFRGQAIA